MFYSHLLLNFLSSFKGTEIKPKCDGLSSYFAWWKAELDWIEKSLTEKDLVLAMSAMILLLQNGSKEGRQAEKPYHFPPHPKESTTPVASCLWLNNVINRLLSLLHTSTTCRVMSDKYC